MNTQGKYLDASKQALHVGDIIESIITGDLFEVMKGKDGLEVAEFSTGVAVPITEFCTLLAVDDAMMLVGYIVHVRSKARKIRR